MPAMNPSGNSLWTSPAQSNPSPCDRYKHACCSYDGSVYILGGRAVSCLRDLWRYSVVRNEWTELSCTSEAAPEELEEHSMVAHEGFLYVFGGMLDSAYTKYRCALFVFDIEKHKWVHCQGKPSSCQPTNRKGHSAVVMDSAMLVYGGFVDMKGSSQDFWSLKLDTKVWSLLGGSKRESIGPGPRHSHSAVVYRDCMYLFGGLKGLREQRDFWKWNSTSHEWTSLRTKSGPSKLMGHSAVAYKDSMLVFGGGESQNAPKNCLWRYSFTTQTWGQVVTHLGSIAPNKIHHCCTGLGPSYELRVTASDPSSSLRLGQKLRPFNNKCFPAPLTFLGSEGAIELKTFSTDKSFSTPKKSELEHMTQDSTEKHAQGLGNCMTFENKAFGKQWSCTQEDLLHEEDDDIVKHLPDLLLFLGGKPCASHSPVSIWHMTLTDC